MSKEDLLKKWLNGELTKAEQKLFEKSPEYKLNKKIVEGAKLFKASNFSEPLTYEQFKAKLSYKKTPVFKLFSYQTISRIAAILVIGIILISYAINSNQVIIKTDAGQQKNIILPDQSTVILNAASSIKFNKVLWYFKRHVNLEGEAFFKVQKGSTFDVMTNQGKVSVVGTQFDVKCRENLFEVKCFEGIVRVEMPEGEHLLTKGKAIVKLSDALMAVSITNDRPAWLNHKNIFSSTPLKQVFKELERQYNVQVQFKNIDLNQKFTGTFVNTDLDQALKAITVPFNLKFKINTADKVITISSE